METIGLVGNAAWANTGAADPSSAKSVSAAANLNFFAYFMIAS
jgi:hypothetical protein